MKFKSTPAMLAAVAALAGCGADEGDSGPTAAKSASTATATPTPEPTPTPKPTVELSVKDRTVRTDSVTLTGYIRPSNAKVRVDGKRAKVSRGKFTMPVTLSKKGENVFRVVASAKGHKRDSAITSITRELTSAERAAIEAQKVADFKASATSLDYDQLLKNPERYRGERAVYTGQIFQIQEGYGGGLMLLSVTNEGYGFWDDNIWVDYDGSIDSAEDDIVTVYGTMKGSKSYETQIGGETYVPRMKMRYIEE